MTTIKQKLSLEQLRASTYAADDVSMTIKRAEIRRRRLKMKLTFQKAATLAGWKMFSSWSQIESGRFKNPRIETLAAMCRVLKCKLDDIVRL